MSDSNEDTLFEFPCEYPIKVVGADEQAMRTCIKSILADHAPEFQNADVKTRPSSKGRYMSMTVVITATSKPQLDAIYQRLVAAEAILYAL